LKIRSLATLALPLLLLLHHPAAADLLVGSVLTDQILRYNGSTGAFVGAFVPAGSGGLDAPSGLIFGPNRNLYVSSAGSARVLRYDGSTGAFLDAFVPPGSGGLAGPSGLIFRPDGNLYVSNNLFIPPSLSAQVLRYNGSTGHSSTRSSLPVVVAARTAGPDLWPGWQPLRRERSQQPGAALPRQHRGVPRQLCQRRRERPH
jgi:hypothetical protein